MRGDAPASEPKDPEEPHSDSAEDHTSDTPRARPSIGDDDHDFAEEHDDATHADEMAGGPEAARDDDEPGGLGGAD
jgi:hypothetical protein